MPATNVKTAWVGGDLYWYDKSGNEICHFDGTSRKLVFPSGSNLTLSGTLTDSAGNNVTNLVDSTTTGVKIARGQITTSSVSDTIVTGLTTVVAAVAGLDDTPAIGVQSVQGSIGNQTGAPSAGNILINSWKATSSLDPTPTVATTFGKKVNYIAIGT